MVAKLSHSPFKKNSKKLILLNLDSEVHILLPFCMMNWGGCVKHSACESTVLLKEKQLCSCWVARWTNYLLLWNISLKEQLTNCDHSYLENEWSAPVTSRKFVGIRTKLELSSENWKFEKLVLLCDLTVPKDISDEIVGDSNNLYFVLYYYEMSQ